LQCAPVQWPQNGNYYEAVANPQVLSWESARAKSVAKGGHLASIASAEEGAFVFGLVNNANYWTRRPSGDFFGPWIGGKQNRNSVGFKEPSGGWEWLTGEPMAYAAWAPGEPNEWENSREDYVFFYGLAGLTNSWADESLEGANYVKGYVVEYEYPIVEHPLPQTVPEGYSILLRVGLASEANSAAVQWLLDDRPISDATNLVLTLENLGPAKLGTYAAAVTTTNGLVFLSKPATVAVGEFACEVYTAVEVGFPSSMGRSYQLQSSVNLESWANFGGVIAGTGEHVSILVSIRKTEKRYYRAVELPLQ
jgi:hypothetical protein